MDGRSLLTRLAQVFFPERSLSQTHVIARVKKTFILFLNYIYNMCWGYCDAEK